MQHSDLPVSHWVARFQSLIPRPGPVLDLACGSGRHVRYLLSLGLEVVAVDRDLSGVADLADTAEVRLVETDLETGAAPPILTNSRYAGVIVTNYLHRPLLPLIVSALAPGGALIYETFARGNERFGKPRNPDFLLAPGELLDAVAGKLHIIAYENVVVDEPRPAAIQRLCARNGLASEETARPSGSAGAS